MRIASVGHVVFAATLIVIGILGLAKGDFAGIWQPVQRVVPARDVLVYICAGVSLAAGIGLLWERTAARAARLLLAWLVIWFLFFKLPIVLKAPTVAVSWESAGESVVIIAAAWILYAALAVDWDRRYLAFASGPRGVRVARALYGLALIAFGAAHFAYMELTAPLIPGWLPGHEAWAYLTGATYIAAGASMITGLLARLAAVLVAWQMGLFTLIVWVPVVIAGANAGQWIEFVVSCALTASGWAIADSYRGPSTPASASRA